MIEEETYAQKLAKSAVDGLLSQVGKKTEEKTGEVEVTIDPETQRKLIEREVKIATDSDFALAEEAKQSAINRMRQSREKPTAETRVEKTEAIKEKVDATKEIGNIAKVLLDLGLPVKAVTAFLENAIDSNSTSKIPINLGGFGGANQGLTLTDVIALLDRTDKNRDNSELETIIREMRDEIKALKTQPRGERVDPVQAQASQLEGLTSLVDSLVKLGVVQRPNTGATVEGEPIEVIKEKNRHVEKMAEVEGENAYKKTKGDVLASIPEKIGHGLAGAIVEQGGETVPGARAVAKTAELEDFKCPGCGNVFKIPTGALQIACPYCPPQEDGKPPVYIRKKED